MGDDPAGGANQPRPPAGGPWSIHTRRPPCVFKPVHGTGVVLTALPPTTPRQMPAWRRMPVWCTIMVADCLPVLLAHTSGAVVGAATRAGGPAGQAGGVLESVMRALFERFQALALINKSASSY